MPSHAASVSSTPALQYRHLPRLPPGLAVERSVLPLAPLPEPQHPSLGRLPLPARVHTLLVHRRSTHLQRPHPPAVGPAPAVAATLASRDCSAVSVRRISPHGSRAGRAYPHQLPLVLVAAPRRAVRCNGSPVGRHGRRG